MCRAMNSGKGGNCPAYPIPGLVCIAILSGASVASSRFKRTVLHYGLVWDLPHFLPGGWTKVV